MRVWVTRQEDEQGPLSRALGAVGLTPVLEPVVEQRVVGDVDAILDGLQSGDWLVLTSPYAIRTLAAHPAAQSPHIAVVGEPSAALARSYGLNVALVSARRSGRSLFDELAQRRPVGRIVYPRSSLAKPPEHTFGSRLEAPVLYATKAREYDRRIVDRVDVVAVASPSAVRAVGKVDLPFASIGRSTSAALQALGLSPWAEATTPGFDALAHAIVARAQPS